jgi:hypothetical protein
MITFVIRQMALEHGGLFIDRVHQANLARHQVNRAER